MKVAAKTARNPAIDVLRGISILWIVGFWHLFDYTEAFPSYQNKMTFRATEVALGVFVLLSGYLLGDRKIEGRHSLLRFAGARFVRIYPPFIVAISLFYLCGLCGWEALAKSAVGISMFWPPNPPTLWFISMLLIFYAVAPALIFIARGRSMAGFTMICVGSTALLYLLSTFIDIRIAIYFPIFAAGIFLANKSGSESRPNVCLLVGLLVVAVLIPDEGSYGPQLTAASTSLFALSGALILFRAAKNVSKDTIPLFPLWAVLGFAGYFMYLFHRPVFNVMHRLYFPEQGALQIAYLILVCLPVVVVLSYFGQKVYDQSIVPLLSAPKGASGQV